MASIVKRRTAAGETRYDVCYRDRAGKKHSVTKKLKRDADEFAATVEADLARGEWVDPTRGRETFGDWWERYRAQRVDLRPSTVARDDAYAAAYLLPELGAIPLGALDHAQISRWVAELKRRGLAPATVGKAKQILGTSLKAAVLAGLIRSNPAAGVKVPKLEQEEQRFLTPAEVATLADTIDPRYRCFVLVGAYCGLRLGELVALRRGRVNLLARTIDVAETVTEASGHLHAGPPKTRAGRRSVPLPRHVAEALEPVIAMTGSDALVFPGPAGGLLRSSVFRPRVWQPAVARAGLAPLRVHDLRHTAVALWLAAGATPLEVARRAGHKKITTVFDVYGHLLPRDDDPVTDRLDELARAARPTPDATVRPMRAR